MDEIPEVFKYLASLKLQDKFIVNGTINEYLLPEDLIEDACSFLFVRDYFAEIKSKRLIELKKAVKAYLACSSNGLDSKQFVYEYQPWIELRNKAKAFLDEMYFDLEAWEQKINKSLEYHNE